MRIPTMIIAPITTPTRNPPNDRITPPPFVCLVCNNDNLMKDHAQTEEATGIVMQVASLREFSFKNSFNVFYVGMDPPDDLSVHFSTDSLPSYRDKDPAHADPITTT